MPTSSRGSCRAWRSPATLGKDLIRLHLLDSDRLDYPRVRFEGKGSSRVTSREFRPAEQQVVVNREGQRLEGIDPEVWEYRIGGYQVLDHWLAGRTDRALGQDEIEELRRIAKAIWETIRVQRRIGELGNRHLSPG